MIFTSNIMKRLHIYTIVFLFTGLATTSMAKSLRILHYGAPKETKIKEAVLYGVGKKAITVQLNRFNFTRKIEISESTATIRVLPKALTEEEDIPEEAPSISIPSDWVDTLLIFFHDPQNKVMPILIKKINASEGAFKPGELYWVNMSNHYVGGLVGQEKLRIAPNKTVVMKTPTQEKECAVKLNFIVKGEKEPRSLLRQMWSINKRTRQVVFILKRPVPQLVGYYVLPIKEVREKAKK